MQHFDPLTFWLKGTVAWMKIVQSQQEAAMRLLGALAKAVPHQSSREIGAEAEAAKAALRGATVTPTRPAPMRHKPAAKARALEPAAHQSV